MNCNHCKNVIPDDSIFCPFCGSPVSNGKTDGKRRVHKINWYVIVPVVCGIAIASLSLAKPFKQQIEGSVLPSVTPIMDTQRNEATPAAVSSDVSMALERLNQGYIDSIDELRNLANQGEPGASEAFESQQLKWYEKAVEYYRNKEPNRAVAIFNHMEDYKDSEKYRILIEKQDYNALLNIISFEDAKDVLISEFGYEYLEGKWVSDDGQYYFSLTKNSTDYSVEYNLPAKETTNKEFLISNGVLYLVPSGTTKFDILMDQYSPESSKLDKVELFHFMPQSANRMQVLCYEGSKFVTLSRQ